MQRVEATGDEVPGSRKHDWDLLEAKNLSAAM
jgi:hypothetical protein